MSISRPQDEASQWTLHPDSDVPSLENAAVAETEDINVCKKACEKGQLKGKGIGCFVQKNGKTVFKQCSYAEAVAEASAGGEDPVEGFSRILRDSEGF